MARVISVCFRGHHAVVPSILATLHHRWGAAAIPLQLPKSAPPQRDARPRRGRAVVDARPQ